MKPIHQVGFTAIPPAGANQRRAMRLLALVWATAFLQGCVVVQPRDGARPPPKQPEVSPPPAPPPRGSGPNLVGVIDVEGNGVTINSRPARDGDLVCNNDSVITDKDSRASIEIQEDYLQFDKGTDPVVHWDPATRCLVVEAFKVGKLIAATRNAQRCMLIRSPDALVRVPVGAVHVERTKPAAGVPVSTKVTPLLGQAVLVLPPSVTATQARAPLPPAAIINLKGTVVTGRTEATFVGGLRTSVAQINVPANKLPPAAHWQLQAPKLNRKLVLPPQ